MDAAAPAVSPPRSLPIQLGGKEAGVAGGPTEGGTGVEEGEDGWDGL